MKITLAEMRQEARRHLRRCEIEFPKQIAAGILKQKEADHRLIVIQANLRVLEGLSIDEEASREFLRGQWDRLRAAESDPNVQAVTEAFPGAKVSGVKEAAE